VTDPFERLTRSHRRLEAALSALAEAARGDRLDETVARDVADFLARQVRRHEADEEESLFPRLASIADVAEVVDQLRAEHRAHVELHERLERALAATAPIEDVRRIAAALEDAYRTHIEIEEAVLFPAARRALSSQDLAAIFDEMMSRRGHGPEGGGRRGDRR
jgi:hemerythrin-like domain-containing protein